MLGYHLRVRDGGGLRRMHYVFCDVLAVLDQSGTLPQLSLYLSPGWPACVWVAGADNVLWASTLTSIPVSGCGSLHDGGCRRGLVAPARVDQPWLS